MFGHRACLKRVRLDDLLRGDVHTLCLEGCHILFGGSSCSGLKQPLHSTKSVQQTIHTFNKQTKPTRVVCVLSSLCLCVALLLPARCNRDTTPTTRPTTKQTTNKQNPFKHTHTHLLTQITNTLSKPTTTKHHQRGRVLAAAAVVRFSGESAAAKGVRRR